MRKPQFSEQLPERFPELMGTHMKDFNLPMYSRSVFFKNCGGPRTSEYWDVTRLRLQLLNYYSNRNGYQTNSPEFEVGNGKNYRHPQKIPGNFSSVLLTGDLASKSLPPPRENITKIIRPEYFCVILGGGYGKIA